MPEIIHVKLPDGSVRDVPRGTSALDIAKSISPRLADAALAAQIKPLSSNGNGSGGNGHHPVAEQAGAAPRLRPCACRERWPAAHRSGASAGAGCRAPHPHRSRSRGARSLSPLVRAPDGRRRARALSRDQARPRPGHRDRLLLRLLSRKALHPRRPRSDREEDAGDREAATCPTRATFCRARRPGALQVRRRLHEVPLHRAVHPARREDFALQDRQVRRLLPRPAHPVHRTHQGVQAAQHRRRLLAGRREESAAAAHLRHLVLLARRISTSTCTSWRKPRSATIACSASSSTCSPFRSSPAPASSSGIPRAASSAKRWKTGCATSTSSAATRWSSRRTSRAAICGRPRGHEGYYAQNMFTPMELDDAEYRMKPMNCPFHILIYKDSLKSYRDLPVRLGELGTVYRYERSGVMHGLLRVRGFTQDDAHIFCTPEQIEDEVVGCIDFALGHAAHLRLRAVPGRALRPGTRTTARPTPAATEQWELAQRSLKNALERRNIQYKSIPGEAAFYGPKIDIKLVDAIGRLWQLSTVQFDFNLPERFELEYVGEDGKRHQPLMVHRALYGSDRALLRRAHRALRRSVPGLAVADAGGHHPHRREPSRLRQRSRRQAQSRRRPRPRRSSATKR